MITVRDFLVITAVMALWGFNFSVIKLGVNNIDPFLLTALRFSFAVFPLIFFIKKPDVSWYLLIAYGLSFGIGVWGLTTLSIDFGLSAGIASLLLNMSVVSSLLIARIGLKENVSERQLLGAGLALVGLALITVNHGGDINWPGLGLVLAASCFWSINGAILKVANTREIFAFNLWAMLFVPIPLFLFAWGHNGGQELLNALTQFNAKALISVLFQAYPTTLLGYWLWNKFIVKYSLSSIAPFTLMVPVFGLLGGYLFYSEAITPNQIAAALCIILGLIIGQRR